jgi:hypothetical protein
VNGYKLATNATLYIIIPNDYKGLLQNDVRRVAYNCAGVGEQLHLRGCGRKWSWSDLSYYSTNCVRLLRKTNVGQDSWYLIRDSNRTRPEYRLRALPFDPTSSVHTCKRENYIKIYLTEIRFKDMSLIYLAEERIP